MTWTMIGTALKGIADKFSSLFARYWSRRLGLRESTVNKDIPAEPPLIVSSSELVSQTQQPADFEEKYNRAQRRALERARRRHDKFVKPMGEPPPTRPRSNGKPEKRAVVEPMPKPPDDFILDLADAVAKEHEVSGQKVLYHQSEFWGEFSFRDTILAQLDRYWIYLRRMRRHDIESYKFYQRLGAQIIPYAATGLRYYEGVPVLDELFEPVTGTELEKYKKDSVLCPSFLKNRPGFGCVAFGASPAHERIESEGVFKGSKGGMLEPKFLYFIKYDPNRAPCEIQPKRGGDIYKMTIWWDKPQDKKIKAGVPHDFAVFISKSGDMQVLRMLQTEMHHVEPKRRKNGHKPYATTVIPERHWVLPYRDWSEFYGLQPETHLAHLFCYAANWIEYARHMSMVSVRVAKEDMIATFGVDIRRTAYFFKDRDLEFNQNGVRKRVFHMVRPHLRNDGSAVKLHFRGEREFDWAGYHVLITVPGRDSLDPADYNVPLSDSERMSPHQREHSINMNEMADFMVQQIREHRGGTHSMLPLTPIDERPWRKRKKEK